MEFIKSHVAYYIEKALMLAAPYEQQYQRLGSLGDCLTEDIANDWFFEDISLLENMYKQGVIDRRAIELYQAIEKNFADVSTGGKQFESEIWTLEGLKNHFFWAKQRALAKELLMCLQKVE